MSTTIKFKNVGRLRKSWLVTYPTMPKADVLIREVKGKGALLSRDIDVEIDEENNRGVVYAGFRTVGEVEVTTNE